MLELVVVVEVFWEDKKLEDEKSFCFSAGLLKDDATLAISVAPGFKALELNE